MLGENLTHYRNLQENGSVNLIEFHTTDNRKFGIGNPDAIKLLLSAAVTELERQLHIAQSGGLPERLEQSWEYKAAMPSVLFSVEFTDSVMIRDSVPNVLQRHSRFSIRPWNRHFSKQ